MNVLGDYEAVGSRGGGQGTRRVTNKRAGLGTTSEHL